jgi:ribosomal subunit interface protein
MNTRIAFRNIEHKPELEEYAQNELAKLNKFFQPDDATIYIDLVIDVEGVDHRLYRAELRVNDKHGQLVSHELGRDLYAVILQAINKMTEELSKSKSRRLDLRDKPHDDVAPVRKDKLDFEK